MHGQGTSPSWKEEEEEPASSMSFSLVPRAALCCVYVAAHYFLAASPPLPSARPPLSDSSIGDSGHGRPPLPPSVFLGPLLRCCGFGRGEGMRKFWCLRLFSHLLSAAVGCPLLFMSLLLLPFPSRNAGIFWAVNNIVLHHRKDGKE